MNYQIKGDKLPRTQSAPCRQPKDCTVLSLIQVPRSVYGTGVKLQSWRAAVSAGFRVVLSTLGSLKSLIG